MTVDIGTYGVWVRVADVTADLASAVEDMGYPTLWIGGSPGGHLDDVETALAATGNLKVVTGIVNMWKTDAAEVAESFARIDDRFPSRFILGVGVGHPEATAEYVNPIDKVNEYLDSLQSAAVPKEQLMLAALGPVALGIAAERTAGSHPYITTPRHTAMAREIMGSAPLLAPEQKVLLTTDVAKARAVGRAAARRYLELTNYRRSFLREGWVEDDLDMGGSDELIDLLALHGTAGEVSNGLKAHLAAGANHVAIQALGDDPLGQLAELADNLA